MRPLRADVVTRGVTFMRAGRPVLSEVDFRAPAGCLTVVLGANGAGKSTLLRVLAGDLAPAEGRVAFAGRALADWSPLELARRRAVVPQMSALAFPFSVLEVVLLGRGPHGRRGDNEAAAWAALEAVDLLALADRDYLTLSGGERQRVHLARALAQVGEPGPDKALFLDEPTSSLDLRHQHGILRAARAFADAGGCVVVVLHDLALGARYAGRAALLHRGRMLGQGAPSVVLAPEWLSLAYGIPVDRIETAAVTHFTVRD